MLTDSHDHDGRLTLSRVLVLLTLIAICWLAVIGLGTVISYLMVK